MCTSFTCVRLIVIAYMNAYMYMVRLLRDWRVDCAWRHAHRAASHVGIHGRECAEQKAETRGQRQWQREQRGRKG